MNFWERVQNWRTVSYFSQGRRWLILLFCILLAGILWLLQAMNATYTKKMRIELEPPALPPKFAFTNESSIPPTIEVSITDQGNKLLEYTMHELFWKKPKLKLGIDSLQLSASGGYLTLEKDELLRQIRNTNELFANHFGSNTPAIISLFPDVISFSYAPLVEQRMEVFFGGQIDFGEESNKMLLKLEMQPDVVTAYGLATSIDSLIQYQGLISTDTNTLLIQEDSVSYHRVALIHPKGIRLTPDSVTIKTVVAPLKYHSFMVNDIAIRNLLEGYKIRLFPASIRVTFLALEEVSLADISNQLHISVDVSELTENSKKLKLHLGNIPKEVQMVQLDPESVEYIIEQE